MPACAIHDGGRDVLSAAAALRTLLEPGDVVLVKGRGSQRFERIRLLLAGRRVGCDIPTCKVHVRPCSDCGMLERGWRGRKVVL